MTMDRRVFDHPVHMGDTNLPYDPAIRIFMSEVGCMPRITLKQWRSTFKDDPIDKLLDEYSGLLSEERVAEVSALGRSVGDFYYYGEWDRLRDMLCDEYSDYTPVYELYNGHVLTAAMVRLSEHRYIYVSSMQQRRVLFRGCNPASNIVTGDEGEPDDVLMDLPLIILSLPGDSDFPEYVMELAKRAVCISRRGQAEVNVLVRQTTGSYTVSSIDVTTFPSGIAAGDLHYGAGFEKFHEDLVKRLTQTKKGLVIFHGVPGTGKTFYIRALMSILTAQRKKLLYIPGSMMQHLTDPSIISYITEWAKVQTRGSVIVMEDAEDVVQERRGRTSGMSALLNITDGIINDVLSMQVILTFNMDKLEIDSALLRPGRLTAIKEFGPLPEQTVRELYRHLGRTAEPAGPMTVAEVYADAEDMQPLTHALADTKHTPVGFSA